jgi:hypothetical protein
MKHFSLGLINTEFNADFKTTEKIAKNFSKKMLLTNNEGNFQFFQNSY